jgi:hypothetical protein
VDDAELLPMEQPAPLPPLPRFGGVEPAAAVPPPPITSPTVLEAHVAGAEQALVAVAARSQPMLPSPIPKAFAEAAQAPIAPSAPPVELGIGAASESPPASKLSRRRLRTKALSFALVPVATLVVALGYQARLPARATGSTARGESARPASSRDTMRRLVAASTAKLAKLEPAPPPASSPLEPVTPRRPTTKKAAWRSPGAVATPTRAQSADKAGASTGILDTTQLPAGRPIVVDGRVVGASPRRVSVRCGTHRIRMGELPTEDIEVPCGGEVIFNDEDE